MARRKANNRLDQALEKWAAWCFSGGGDSGGASMLARLIDNRGELIFSASGGRAGPVRDLESDIEACVVSMASKSRIRAEVLRMEYIFAGSDTTQTDRALRLGVGHSTYERHLMKARKTIEEQVLGA